MLHYPTPEMSGSLHPFYCDDVFALEAIVFAEDRLAAIDAAFLPNSGMSAHDPSLQ